jgi:phage shock protein A
MTPEQVRALRESATNIIAYQKQLEGQRKKLYDDLEKVNTRARQAVMMAEEASRAGDADGAARFNESAAIISEEIVSIDTQIAAIDIELLEANQASEEAKSIASDSAIQMTQMKAKGAELRAEFERAKMAEASLEATGSPSYDEVKEKIGGQLAQAEARAELADAEGQNALDGATAMVEKAAMESKAAARLAEIRSQMGVASPEPAPVEAPVDAEPETPQDDPPTSDDEPAE